MKKRLLLLLAVLGLAVPQPAQVPFTIQGLGVNPAQFRVTTFATGISFVLGMAELSDGSILAAISDSSSYFTSNGRLVRFVDANKDGVADAAGLTLVTGLSGGLTSLRIGGKLVFTTGQKKPIAILRLGATPSSPITLIGTITFTYPSGGWLHPHSAVGIRQTPGTTNAWDIFFQLGSAENFTTTALTKTVSLGSTGSGLLGVGGTLVGDSFYKLTITDNGTSVTASELTQVANGLRNPSGFTFHPTTGDLYFEDNGIDGVVDANEPTSADELNMIPAADIGGAVEFFGFPSNYTKYRTGEFIGGAGIAPLVAFQPIPLPNGEETEGPNDVEFAPPGFPDALADGVFVTFHGKFNFGGTQNEENGMCFVNLTNNSYFHFIPSKLPGVGHLDGLLRTSDSLFISDLSKTGNLSNATGTGVIYQIKSLVGPSVQFQTVNGKIQLNWRHGALERATELGGTWTTVAPSPENYLVTAQDGAQFFRTRN
jgi:hypothetical protein